ncbi:hypothetical protein Acsp04_18620 [Actinomadura sp. NBRC 104425]|uniref:serine/threonine-protein kinase n=1 Tax=Actinomadura sp. NBRC 104425 TaxID=3032204 RepID=UPI0024A47959|nr:serine/threonine-protein kinase [Actinomadura sp. NBRC 104425]GLZ11627.1 hypothetical protein Acsp04_18620 [Actinomadura sp. NBRC 104425]
MRGGLLAGRYRLESRLGSGGMGEVWSATDLRLGRPVAVKILSRGTEADERAVARFRREAEIAGGLRHPGITVLFDFDADDGRLFLVMELLRGRDLAAVMAAHPHGMPPALACDLAAQIADALAAAHERGVVHRDVKPANVMVLPDQKIKILDFGIARYADRTSDLTGGAAIGTPSYMAPEQFEGDAAPDARTDLYALGAVLFFMLTGRRPFEADTAPALIKEILLTEPPRVRDLRPEVPADLDRLVAALLAKNPADRPAQARLVADVLRGAAAAPQVPHRPPGGTLHATRRLTGDIGASARTRRRNRWWWLGLLPGAALLAYLFVLWSPGGFPIEDGRFAGVPQCDEVKPANLPAHMTGPVSSRPSAAQASCYWQGRTDPPMGSHQMLTVTMFILDHDGLKSGPERVRRYLGCAGKRPIHGIGDEACVESSNDAGTLYFRISNMVFHINYGQTSVTVDGKRDVGAGVEDIGAFLEEAARGMANRMAAR